MATDNSFTVHDLPPLDRCLVVGGPCHMHLAPIISDRAEGYKKVRLKTILGSFQWLAVFHVIVTLEDLARVLRETKYAVAFGVD